MMFALRLMFSAVVRDFSSRIVLPSQPIARAASRSAAASERSLAPKTLPPESISVEWPGRSFASWTAA